MHAICIVR